MKLKNILGARDALKKLSEKHFVNFKVVRAIADLIKAINTELEFFETESEKLIKLYAELDENGQPKMLPNGLCQLKSPEDKAAFDKEYAELLNLDISDRIHPVAISEADFKTTTDLLTPLEMLALDELIEWKD